MRKLTTNKQKLELTDDIETIFEKSVTKFGNGAKLDCPKQHLGKKAYIIIRKST
jgi:putative transposon-encoded protein